MFTTAGTTTSTNTTVDEIISLQGFSDVLTMYAIILSICSVVALFNYHRLHMPLPISLSLSGLVMSIILIVIDAAFATEKDGLPIKTYIGDLLAASDFDEVILRFGIGFIMFASAMESDIQSLKPQWSLIFLLSGCGVVISIVLCGGASLAIFLGFGFWTTTSAAGSLSHLISFTDVLTCVLFGAVVAPTDAHHFVLEALHKSGAPESFSAIIVGEGLTNDALAVVAFSIVKTAVDSLYVTKNGGCGKILTRELCTEMHMCTWEDSSSSGSGSSSSSNSSSSSSGSRRMLLASLATNATTVNGAFACVDHGSEISGNSIWGEMATDIFGGVFIGVFMAWVFSAIMRRVRQPNINILLSITLVLDVIVVSNYLHSSPAVACAAAGLFLRAFGLKYLERRSLEQLDIVWKFFEEALSGVFFLLIGLCIITDKFTTRTFFASITAIPITLAARWCSVALPLWAWNKTSVRPIVLISTCMFVLLCKL